MQLKQAQAVLSDVLLKCESERIALPRDPLDAVLAAVHALRRETKHEVGRPQIEAAMASLRTQFGVVHATTPSKPPASHSSGRQQDAHPRTAADSNANANANEPGISGSTISPPPRKRAATGHSKSKGPSKIQSDVLSKRAKRNENQPLVEQLVELGAFELQHGHTQRGVARMRAAKQVRDADEAITSGAQARQLDRVGPSAAAKVDAILHGGLANALREYDSLSVEVVGDSSLILGQLERYRPPKNKALRPLYSEARRLADVVRVDVWHHHLRAFNKMADAAANIAMDARASIQTLHPSGRPHTTTIDSFLQSDIQEWRSRRLLRSAQD